MDRGQHNHSFGLRSTTNKYKLSSAVGSAMSKEAIASRKNYRTEYIE
jgi:hypothetical protein